VTDKREQLLVYLSGQLATLPNIGTAADGTPAVYRDRGEVLEPNKPAVVLLDGVERTESVVRGTNVVVMPPAVVGLIPQIFVLLRMRDDGANTHLDGQLAPIGPELSAWRANIIALLAQDNTLAAMLGTNGRIEYRGSETDMQTGSTIGVEGAVLQMNFALFYVLDPSQLP
jgi:hypothetical protein